VLVLGVKWWVRMRSQQDARYKKQRTKTTRREHVKGLRARNVEEECARGFVIEEYFK
jgi:hypothetical protein